MMPVRGGCFSDEGNWWAHICVESGIGIVLDEALLRRVDGSWILTLRCGRRSRWICSGGIRGTKGLRSGTGCPGRTGGR